jgi:phenylalanine-4-hydroxylase
MIEQLHHLIKKYIYSKFLDGVEELKIGNDRFGSFFGTCRINNAIELSVHTIVSF